MTRSLVMASALPSDQVRAVIDELEGLLIERERTLVLVALAQIEPRAIATRDFSWWSSRAPCVSRPLTMTGRFA